MAGTSTPIFPQTINQGAVQILPADTTTLKTIYTGGSNGSKIDNLLISSSDQSTRDIQVYITISAVDYLIGTITVPATAGFVTGTSPINFFQHPSINLALDLDNNGNKYMYLKSGAILKIKSLATVTAAKFISVIAQAGDY